jgi:deoxyribodipyrimidine photolyase-related protein
MTDPHRLFGDQLGPHFLTPGDDGGPVRDAPVAMIEARSVFRRQRFHRANAHLVLSAMRHRAAELGGRVRYARAETYREGLGEAIGDAPVTVHHPFPGAVQERLPEQPTRRTKALPGAKYSPDEFTPFPDQSADHDTEGRRAGCQTAHAARAWLRRLRG